MRSTRILRGTNIYLNDDVCVASQARAQGKIAYFMHTKLIVKDRFGTENDLGLQFPLSEDPPAARRDQQHVDRTAAVVNLVVAGAVGGDVDGLGTTVNTENIGMERQACAMQDYPILQESCRLA